MCIRDNSEAYAAGELKHGTISLMEEGTLVVALATQDTLYPKTVSNMIEVKDVYKRQGHNLPIGALGVFILWLGWYGFNGAAATSVEELGSIFVTTKMCIRDRFCSAVIGVFCRLRISIIF